ncbi:MAG: hypothetical protein HUU03_02570, partial [Planctomycetaceae bacterium]|nr:hypothetical protein [Planctomycetaceae bacterium]
AQAAGSATAVAAPPFTLPRVVLGAAALFDEMAARVEALKGHSHLSLVRSKGAVIQA